MLVRLTNDQIITHWGSISSTLADYHSKVGVMEQLLMCKMACWLNVKNDNPPSIDALILTQIEEDVSEGVKRLVIVYMSAYGNSLGSLAWRSGLATIIKYAASEGCTSITAWSENSHLRDFLVKLGGEVKQVIVIPLTKIGGA